MCACICVCMCILVCMYACMHVVYISLCILYVCGCVHVYICGCRYVVCTYVCTVYVCMHTCGTCLFVYVCMWYMCMYVCGVCMYVVYVCMWYVSLSVCVYVCIGKDSVSGRARRPAGRSEPGRYWELAVFQDIQKLHVYYLQSWGLRTLDQIYKFFCCC